MYSEAKLNTFLDELSSDSSIPGGGSAAALAGATTASVVIFIANLTIGKEKYKDVEAEACDIMDKATGLKKRMLEMMDEDSQVLRKILDSYKAGDQEKIQQVCREAVEFSMEMTEKCLDLMELALHISKIGNRMLASDFEVAAYLGDGAVNSAIANVKINLSAINDEDYVNEIKEKYLDMQSKSEEIKEEIIEIAK